MKVAALGLDIAFGKYKYEDECFRGLVEKYKPKKTSPYFLEFIENPQTADVIAYWAEKKVDLIINDLDLIEKRLLKAEDEAERKLLAKLQENLEKDKLIFEIPLQEEERSFLKNLNFLSLRPCVLVEKNLAQKELVAKVFENSGFILFYTAGVKEVHAWPLRQGENILAAAGKIHSDLARGFIKGEVVSCGDLLSVFNLAEAKAKGLVKSVDKDYIMKNGDVIEIKFSV